MYNTFLLDTQYKLQKNVPLRNRFNNFMYNNKYS